MQGARCAKVEFFRDHFADKIALADEQRRDENARHGNFRKDFFDLRLLFPERLADAAENFPAAQFRRVLEHRRGGLVVQFRAVAEDDQHGIGKTLAVHTPKLAQPRADRKPRPSGEFFIEPFARFARLTL